MKSSVLINVSDSPNINQQTGPIISDKYWLGNMMIWFIFEYFNNLFDISDK